jgi:hypothetical protein
MPATPSASLIGYTNTESLFVAEERKLVDFPKSHPSKPLCSSIRELFSGSSERILSVLFN